MYYYSLQANLLQYTSCLRRQKYEHMPPKSERAGAEMKSSCLLQRRATPNS